MEEKEEEMDEKDEKEKKMDLYVFVHLGWEIRSRVGVGEGDGRRSGAMRTIKGSTVATCGCC